MSKTIRLKITKKKEPKFNDVLFTNIVTKSKQIMEYNNNKMISVKHIKFAIKELFNSTEAEKYITECKALVDAFEDDNQKPTNFKSIKKKLKNNNNSRVYDKSVVFLCGLV
jgi:hypothetical protein